MEKYKRSDRDGDAKSKILYGYPSNPDDNEVDGIQLKIWLEFGLIGGGYFHCDDCHCDGTSSQQRIKGGGTALTAMTRSLYNFTCFISS